MKMYRIKRDNMGSYHLQKRGYVLQGYWCQTCLSESVVPERYRPESAGESIDVDHALAKKLRKLEAEHRYRRNYI
jgi:hypothetical protein